jgi:hypothetical protein
LLGNLKCKLFMKRSLAIITSGTTLFKVLISL